MKNPFVYGEIVTGKDFADRIDEIKELIRVNSLLSAVSSQVQLYRLQLPFLLKKE